MEPLLVTAYICVTQPTDKGQTHENPLACTLNVPNMKQLSEHSDASLETSTFCPSQKEWMGRLSKTGKLSGVMEKRGGFPVGKQTSGREEYVF